ncbi:MAG: hypothetical protein ABIG44_09895 [Planctomycetota bacterium]
MMHIRIHVFLLLFVLGFGLDSSPAAAQPPAGTTDTLPPYKNVDQVKELDDYLEKFRTADPPSPLELKEFSRLLGEPFDQIVWLIARMRNLPEGQAEVLRGLIEQRLEKWIGLRVAEMDTLRSFLQPVVEVVPIAQVIDHQELVRRLPGETELTSLEAPDQFKLLARGVPAEALGVGRREPWDQPRRVLMELGQGSSGSLPPMWELLELDRELREKRVATLQNPPDTNTRATFDIAAALLGRAMGLDGATRGVPNEDNASYWQTMADQLEAEDTALWQWAAAARILQAANSTTAGDAIQKATEQLGKAQAVATLDLEQRQRANSLNSLESWIAKLNTSGGSTVIEGELPLGPNFRRAATSARQGDEQQVESLWARAKTDPDALDRAFQAMQRAKSSSVPGIPDDAIQPVTLNEMRSWFSIAPQDYPDIHLFLEVLETSRGTYAVMLRSSTGTTNPVDTWMTKALGPASLSEVLREAMGAGANFGDGRILYAPDGTGRTPAGLKEAEGALLEGVRHSWTQGKLRERPSWLVYLPSAAVFKARGAWTDDRALRLWAQQAAAATPADQGVIGFARLQTSDRGPALLPAPGEGRPAKMMMIRVGSTFKRFKEIAYSGQPAIDSLMKAKNDPNVTDGRESTAGVILLTISESNAGG